MVVVVVLLDAHASLDPHASMLERLEEKLGAAGVTGFCCAEGTGADRLKAESMDGAVGRIGGEVWVVGIERSNKSPMPLEPGVGLELAEVADGEVDDEKSLSPPLGLKVRWCAGGDVGLAAGFETVSKKPPPLPKMLGDIVVWAVVRLLLAPIRSAKGEGLG